MSSISSTLAVVEAQRAADRSQLNVTLLRKQLDVQRDAGEAINRLTAAAAQTAAPSSGAAAGRFDVTV